MKFRDPPNNGSCEWPFVDSSVEAQSRDVSMDFIYPSLCVPTTHSSQRNLTILHNPISKKTFHHFRHVAAFDVQRLINPLADETREKSF